MNTETRRQIVSYDYWTHKISRKQLSKYLKALFDRIERSERLKYKPIEIDGFNFYSRECGENILVIFVTSINESDDDIINKINRLAQSLRSICDKKTTKQIKKNFVGIVDPYIVSTFSISLIGESGVGKTSLLGLLMGRKPPEEHQPTIALNTEIIENIRFANYELMILDFAGQDSARDLWDFATTDMIFLLTDSTLKNIIASKALLTSIEKKHPNLPVIIFANKQDLPNALDPTAISKVMGVDTRSMVAVDLAYRNRLLTTLTCILCEHFNLEVPDVAADELLYFVHD